MPAAASERSTCSAQIAARAVAMIAVVEAEQVEAVAREQPQPAVEGVDVVEVEQQLEQPVIQAMPRAAAAAACITEPA